MNKQQLKALNSIIDDDNLDEFIAFINKIKVDFDTIKVDFTANHPIFHTLLKPSYKIIDYLLPLGLLNKTYFNETPFEFAVFKFGTPHELVSKLMDAGLDVTLGKGEKGVKRTLENLKGKQFYDLYYRVAAHHLDKTEEELKTLAKTWPNVVYQYSMDTAMDVLEKIRKAGRRIDELQIIHKWKDVGELKIRVRYDDFSYESFKYPDAHQSLWYIPVDEGDYEDEVIPKLEKSFQELAEQGYFADIITDKLEIEAGHFSCTDPVGKPIINKMYSEQEMQRFIEIKERVMTETPSSALPRELHKYCENACYVLGFMFRRPDLVPWDSEQMITVADRAFAALHSDNFTFRMFIQDNAPTPESADSPLIDFWIWFALWNSQSKSGEQYVARRFLDTAIKLGSEKARMVEKIGSGKFGIEDAILDTSAVSGSANDVYKVIKISLKEESEQAYSDTLDFINNLMEKGFAPTNSYQIEFEGKGKSQLPMTGIPKYVSVYNLFANAANYPGIYPKIRKYAELVMKRHTWYNGLDGENSAMPGTFAVYALGLNDPEYFDLVLEFLREVDSEHQYTQRDFTYAFIKKWGYNEVTISILINCISATTDLEIDSEEIVSSPVLLRRLLQILDRDKKNICVDMILSAFFEDDLENLVELLDDAKPEIKPYLEALLVCADPDTYSYLNTDIQAVLDIPLADRKK